MIEATKILFDAGAINRSIYPNSDNDSSTPWEFIADELSYNRCCERNYSLGNIYEATYQVYEAKENGIPYKGIDSYEAAIGKKIIKVLADNESDKPVFFKMDLLEFKKDNCFTSTLYFVYDDGVLISTQYGELWTNSLLSDKNLKDISYYFKDIIGSEIESFKFNYKLIRKGRTEFAQPIIKIKMDSGKRMKISNNYGEVSKENGAAYLKILD